MGLRNWKSMHMISLNMTSSSYSSVFSYRSPLRTLDDVRNQVAMEVAVKATNKSETLDGVKIGVWMTLSKTDGFQFLRKVADALENRLRMQRHLFAITTTGPILTGPVPKEDTSNLVIICASTPDLLQRAILLTSAKFVGRITSADGLEDNIWLAGVKDVGQSIFDEEALWDVVRKSAREPIDPLPAPPGSRGIEEILLSARARLERLSPREAYNELQEPAVRAPTFLVDIRPAEERELHGSIEGSLIVERNLLEWKFDPRSDKRMAIIANRFDLRIIIFCTDGTASSLAANSLQQIGLLNATDIVGGYQAWKSKGLPIHVPPPRSVGIESLAGSEFGPD